MAVLDVIQTKYAEGSVTINAVLTSNVTAGNLLAVVPFTFAGQTLVSLTDNQSNTYSLYSTSNFYLATAASTGALTVTLVTTGGGGTTGSLIVYELEGPSLVGGLIGSGGGSGSAWSSGIVNTSQSARMLALGIAVGADVNAPSSGWTTVHAANTGGGIAFYQRYMYSNSTTAGTYEADGTLSGSVPWGGGIIEIKQSGGGGSTGNYYGQVGYYRKKLVGWRKSMGGLFIPPQVSLV